LAASAAVLPALVLLLAALPAQAVRAAIVLVRRARALAALLPVVWAALAA